MSNKENNTPSPWANAKAKFQDNNSEADSKADRNTSSDVAKNSDKPESKVQAKSAPKSQPESPYSQSNEKAQEKKADAEKIYPKKADAEKADHKKVENKNTENKSNNSPWAAAKTSATTDSKDSAAAASNKPASYDKAESKPYQKPAAKQQDSDNIYGNSKLVAKVNAKKALAKETGVNETGASEVADKPVKANTVFDGVILGHPDGFAFFIADEKIEDTYIPVEEMFKALHGDRVRVKRIPSKSQQGKPDRYRGEILDYISRGQKSIVGSLEKKGPRWFFVPREMRYARDFIISTRDENISEDFDINTFTPKQDGKTWVVAEVLNDGLLTSQPAVKILHELTTDFEAMPFWQQSVLEKGVPHTFSQSLLDSIDTAALAITEDEYKQRTDFRHLPFVTIDGETARDFDDAVYVEQSGSGFDLYVAIADVSRYIQPNTAIDVSALERGNSIYFPQHVIPMLPEIYSNEWCSLNPEVDRLVMVCKMHINSKGKQQSYQFYEGIIHSQQRLTYTQVHHYLEAFKATQSGEADAENAQALAVFSNDAVKSSIDNAYVCYSLLRKARTKRGALDFDMPSSEIIMDDQGKLADIIVVRRNEAHTLIEEFMLSANVAAGEFIDENIKLGMYRVHDKPEEKKLMQLKAFLATFNLSFPIADIDDVAPEMFMQVINQLKDKSELLPIIQPMLLRSQQQAQYQSDPAPHFALNFPLYSHFTSPIRRYPDLCVHRLIRSLLRERPVANRFLKQLPSIAKQCSFTERRAEDMSRDVDARLKLEFLEKNVGDYFFGVITGVKDFGFFVELESILVSGLVAAADLTKTYQYDDVKQQLQAGSDPNIFSMGKRVQVQVVSVDVAEKRLDLRLVEDAEASDK